MRGEVADGGAGRPGGVSQSTAPSSTAISVAYAVSSFVTEARRNPRSVSPAVVVPPR